MLHDQPRLLVSLHDVSPRFEGAIDRLRDLLAEKIAVNRVALLVVPDHWGSAPIIPGSSFARRLRLWAHEGAEIFQHGWLHRDDTPHATRYDRFKARHMTASEGEFLGLSHDKALGLMRDGRHLLEDVTGRTIAGFIAPAWLYGKGAHQALTEAGFELAEDHLRVWNPQTGERLCTGPVLTWASRSRMRTASSLLAASVLPVLLRRQRVARIAVHPGDTTKPALLASIRRAVDRMLETHVAGRYADLLPGAG